MPTNNRNTSNNQDSNIICDTVKLNRGGGIKEVSLEQLRKPHAFTYGSAFKANHPVIKHDVESGNAGGLLRNGEHRPTVTEANKNTNDHSTH